MIKYEINTTPRSDGLIIQEVDFVNDSAINPIREAITRQVINTCDVGTKEALNKLGWHHTGDTTPSLRPALEALLKHYVDGVNSGDGGNWNPEEEPVVIAARAALKESK